MEDLFFVDAMITIVLLFITAIGFLFAVFGGVIIIRSARTKNWSQAVGTIVGAEVRRHETINTDGRPSITYYPYVTYEYAVGGVGYQGDQISAGLVASYHDSKSAESSLGQYPIGKQVVVTYNPSHPKEAVLIVGGSIGNGVLFFVGMSIFIAGLVGLARQ